MNLANARRKPECRSRRAGDIDHKNIGVKEENCPYGLLAISHGSCDVKVLAQLLTKISESASLKRRLQGRVSDQGSGHRKKEVRAKALRTKELEWHLPPCYIGF